MQGRACRKLDDLALRYKTAGPVVFSNNCDAQHLANKICSKSNLLPHSFLTSLEEEEKTAQHNSCT